MLKRAILDSVAAPHKANSHIIFSQNLFTLKEIQDAFGRITDKIDSSLGAVRFVPLAGFDLSTIRAFAKSDRARAIEAADEIVAGFYRPYQGGSRAPLRFPAIRPDQHWTRVQAPRNGDVKDL